MKRKYFKPEINIMEFEREDTMDVGDASVQGTFEILDHNAFTE